MKAKLFISAIAVVLSVGMVTAQNQNPVRKDTTTSTQNGPAFVDKDNNGVCDNFENGTAGQGRGPGNGTGLRNGKGRAVNFVDADNNGICDRREPVK